MTNIANTDYVIDSRDVIARIEELEEDRAEIVEALDEATDDEARNDLSAELEAWDDDFGPELSGLKTLADECEGIDDWEYGALLIRDNYFTDYARELLTDIGDLPSDLPHYIVIDWEQTAKNIQADYSSVEFEGVTYWVR